MAFAVAWVCFGCAAAHGQDPGAVTLPPLSATHELLFRRLEKQFPSLEPAVMVRFYEENSPDILEEFQSRCTDAPAGAGAYLRLMTEHFLKVYALRDTYPDDYERALQLERLESNARRLARTIRDSGADGQAADDQKPAEDELAEARKELRQNLEKSFRFSQQNQLIEVNRLEAEVRDLRRLLQEREANRALILQQRYLQFTGEKLPDRLTADQPRQ